MIDVTELIDLTEEQEERSVFRLGTVAELFNIGTAKVQFDGEEEPSAKEYSYLDSYKPKIGDRVLLASASQTYIVLGKINYNVPPDEEIDRYKFDEKKVTMDKGLEVKDGIVVSSGGIKSNSLEATGTLKAGVSTLGAVTAGGNSQVNGTLGISSTLTASGAFHHRGSYISFFNKFQNNQRATVPNISSDDPTTIRNKLNDLLTALRNYGLIG